MRHHGIIVSLAVAAVLALGRVASAQSAPKVGLHAATAVENGKTEVRLQIRLEEGWLPAGGIRIERELNGKKTEVFRSKPVDDAAVDRVLDPSLRGQKLWLEASRALARPRALDFAVVRPPSASARFRESKAATKVILDARAKGAADAASRGQLQSGLQRLKQSRAPVAAAPTAAGTAARPSPDDAIIAARSRLMLSTLVDRKVAEELGLAATDASVKAGDTPTYTVFAVNGGRDGATLATLRFTVGADAQPPAPANVESMQLVLETGDPVGKLAVRWDRIDPALEAKLLNVSYRIERFDAALGAPDAQKPTAGAKGRGAVAPSATRDLGSRAAAAAAGGWTPATRKPLMISALEGNTEPESFFTDTLETPGVQRYRIATVDGFGRMSGWTAFEATAVEWRRPDEPRGVAARLDDQPRDEQGSPVRAAGAKPTADQLRAMGLQGSRTPIGIDRGGTAPRDLSVLSSAILAGKGRPVVNVTWTPVEEPRGLTARYRIFRIDADTEGAAPVLLTPEPIAGEQAPPEPSQRAAEQELLRLEAEIKSVGLPPQLRQLAVADRARARGLQSQRAATALDAAPRRIFTDKTARLDARYRYVVRAVFTESGLESIDALTPVVGVPSPHRPPAVAQVRFAGFSKSESLAPAQLLDAATATREGAAGDIVPFALARGSKPRLAPPPTSFKPAGGAASRSFSLSRPLGVGVGAAAGKGASQPKRPRSSPGAISGEVEGADPEAQDSRRVAAPPAGMPRLDLEVAQLAKRVPAMSRDILARLGSNLLRARDDGGTVRIEWAPVPNLRDVTYRVRRKADGGEFVEVGVTKPNVTSFVDVVPRTVARSYTYEIAPISRWGVMGQVAAGSSVVAQVPSTVRPTRPNLLNASPDAAADRAIRLRIDPNPAEESVSLYRVFRDGQAIGEVRAAGASGELVFVDSGLDPARKAAYAYKVVAETAVGLLSAESRTCSSKAVRLELAAPAQFRATVGSGGVALAWASSPDAVSYMVLRRGADGGAPVVLAAEVRGTAFTDALAYPGNAYSYELVAKDAQGTTSRGAQATITVP